VVLTREQMPGELFAFNFQLADFFYYFSGTKHNQWAMDNRQWAI
jgi:hypothetical protein